MKTRRTKRKEKYNLWRIYENENFKTWSSMRVTSRFATEKEMSVLLKTFNPSFLRKCGCGQ